jgi:formyl-CoA transferase
LRVLEVATYVLGPAAATVMSDFGAEVIKVERPGTGDPYRYLSYVVPMPQAEMNYCWLLDGRNKRSIALDLTTDEGRDILLSLAARCDVFITNFQPSILCRLRLNFADVAAVNERVIYASATGYGEQGDETESPGFDLTAYWARSGLMDVVHNDDAEPSPSTCAMGDHPSSLALFGAIMLGLYHRQLTGKGTKVTTSLAANGAWANGCLIQSVFCNAIAFGRPIRSQARNPLINHYVTRDARRFVLCLVQAEKDWPNLCRAIAQPELVHDARFTTQELRMEHRAELVAIIDAAILSKDLAEWKSIFAQHELVWAPVQTTQEVAADKQLEANGVIVEFDHPQHGRLKTINSPLFVEGSAKVKPRAAPEVGQHTREVLRELGHADETIDQWIARGIAAGS